MAGMQFYLKSELNGPEKGPFTLEQIQQLIRSRKLRQNHFVRRGESTKWTAAAEALAKVFAQVESQPPEMEPRDQRFAEQLEQVEILESEALTPPPLSSKPPKRRKQLGTAGSGNFRSLVFQKLFGRIRPTQYWGFQIQGMIINVAIGLVLVAAAMTAMFYIAMGIVGMFMFEGPGPQIMEMVADTFLYTFLSIVLLAISTFLAVAFLVFYRNMIDWMIDMESHAQALRNYFAKEAATHE